MLDVAAFPVDLAAAGALPEFIEIQACPGLEQVFDRFLVNRFNNAVTAGTAAEWNDLLPQVKTPDDFVQLFAWVMFTDAITVGNDAAFQQVAVTGEQDAMLPG